MSANQSSKLIIGVVIGVVVGVVGLLSGQYLLDDERNTESGGSAGRDQAKQVATSKVKLVDSVRRPVRLDTGGNRLSTGSAKTQDSDLAIEEEEEEKEENSILKVLMDLGAREAENKASKEATMLAERLDLNASQKDELQELLADKTAKQQKAGMLLFSGKATVDDLVAADEHNYSEVDAAMQELLSGTQLEEYNAYTEDREVKRIERKSNEDLAGLRGVGDLTEDQAAQAMEIFIEINAAEKPGQLPPGTTAEDFNGIIDQALNNRVERLAPILTESQLSGYQTQIDGFRKMISAFTSGGQKE